jgi:ABC-type polysaccharide/polyol phosphate transport system ATPase subunit
LPTLPKGSIVADHVWKQFRADRTRPRLHDHLTRLGRQVRGERRRWRWALRDISFTVEPGGSTALIGLNGSGKSTMLKIISHVTYETAGRCEAQGRIGALLEVRSGINPKLTGRENIYLYGNILGLTKRQITERFDAIVEFAELSEAVDRQVKFFSTGMQVRLGFSIAAHLDPDILLVDEVLAVGDANFQQKCLQRISEVVAEGTTLLFVSHDLASVEAMCEQAVWLADGVARAQGPTRDVLSLYRGALKEDALVAPGESEARVLKVEIAGPGGGALHSGEDADVRLTLRAPAAGSARFYLGVSEGTAMPIFVASHDALFPEGDFELRCVLRNLPLPKGRYYLWASIEETRRQRAPTVYFSWRPVSAFDVVGMVPVKPPGGVMVLSPVHVDSSWELS